MIEFDTNVEFLRMAFWNTFLISVPILAVALAIGLFIGIFQAATSINEMTLVICAKSDVGDDYFWVCCLIT